VEEPQNEEGRSLAAGEDERSEDEDDKAKQEPQGLKIKKKTGKPRVNFFGHVRHL